MKTEDLIKMLSQDTAVVTNVARTLGWAIAGGTLIAGLAFFAAIGFRPDIATAAETVRFLFKFVITISLAGAALGMVLRLARPGVPLSGWGWALAAAPVLLGVAVLVELSVTPEAAWVIKMTGTNARNCLTIIPLLSIGPLACLLLALRQGAPSRPGLAGAIAGLASSGIAATFYASNCTDDSPLFVVTWYPLAVGIVVLVGYLAGTRLLKW
ncbi:NrsF family protein [Pararhizobium sp.]|uniref:NrsF family protein n=1 Tax=Pararhizobium sp. TaxID=1977563 RepID=UPI002718E4D1|nr:NrsF family protein [Pararhizobium sp.]MDO9416706.1 NrsF family protein [Pararhizobium sp.]